MNARRAPANEIVTFRCDAATAKKIRQAARDDGRRVSPFLRMLVVTTLATPSKGRPEDSAA